MANPAPISTDEEYDILATDFEAYAEAALVVRTKDGGIEPLILNSSQRFVHARLERQLRETGKVRAIILKGRQQGVSTYTEGRFYWKTTHGYGQRAFILTHEDAATQNLFEMAKRFHDNCPEDLRPETSAANAKELSFSVLNGGYRIATAGGRPAGRSSTIQLFHGSEFGFWPNAEEHMAAALEAVPKTSGEIILESTANRPGDAFHRMWRASKRGDTSFEAIFVPWFIHDEYRTEPPAGWSAPEAFRIYQRAHGITDAQLYWAYMTNRDMAAAQELPTDVFCGKFKREYPATDDEAFEAAGDDLSRVIPMEWVRIAQFRWKERLARQTDGEPGTQKGRMTGLGLDVAQGGADKTVLAPLHGLRFEPLVVLPGAITPDGPAVAAQVLRHRFDDATIAIDLGGGWGGDAYTHLRQLGMKPLGVDPGAGSSRLAKDRIGFRNKRAELWWLFREALNPVTGEEIELPDDPELTEELCCPTWETTPSGRQIEAKDDLRARLKRSTDRADAVLLAWAAGCHHARHHDHELAGPATGARERSPRVQQGYARAKDKYRSRR